MNDLMPPTRRRMPEQHRDALRRLLLPETSPRRLSRSSTPWLAAAAVAAITAGGYGVATTLGDGDRGNDGVAPAGGTTSPTPPKPSPSGRTPPQNPPSTTPTLTAEGAYDTCETQVRRQARLMGDGPVGDVQGRVITSTADATTVVVSDGMSAWACNVAPDTALSHEVPDAPPHDVDAGTFAFALNAASNVGAGPGNLSWAGGVLPRGVSGLTYVFPDGHAEPAVTNDGYWVMQYLSPEPWGRNLNTTDPVQVQLTGPGGDQTVTVPLGFETVCNQVTHGC